MEQEKTYNKQSVEKKQNSKGVYVAVLNQGSIRPELSYLLTDLTHQNKYRLFLTYPAAKPISNNRNHIVKDFLKRTEYDYLLMFDNDIIPPLNVLDLVDFDKDIIGGVCFGFMDNSIIPLVVDDNTPENMAKGEKPFLVKEMEGDEGLVECGGLGTGLMIIKREVLEKVKAPFSNIYDEDGIKTMGLDFSFCKKARALGYKVFTHTDFLCSHWTQMDLKMIYTALQKRSEIRKQPLK